MERVTGLAGQLMLAKFAEQRREVYALAAAEGRMTAKCYEVGLECATETGVYSGLGGEYGVQIQVVEEAVCGVCHARTEQAEAYRAAWVEALFAELLVAA